MDAPAIRRLDSVNEGWRLLRCAPDSLPTPDDLPPLSADAWIDATVPGTVAQTLNARGEWRWDCAPDLDDSDWWYACRFDGGDAAVWQTLAFEGLATLCEVWLNGEKLGETDNMFRAYRFDMGGRLRTRNLLLLRFRSLNPALAMRRPRPAWKTRLVRHQNLRFHRTTLLGRIPGWSPPAVPVGPWRGVALHSALQPRGLQCLPRLDAGESSLVLRATWPDLEQAPGLTLCFDGVDYPLQAQPEGDGWRLDARIPLPAVEPWMPHTHGRPRLYDAQLDIEAHGQQLRLDLPKAGFRAVEVDRQDGDFALRINGVPVFCRGACWTVNDMLSLDGDPDRLRDTLTLMQQSGANMIRVGGTMTYEQDAFYALCDELGILVWQDFMFANMDYPRDDADFDATVAAEARDQLRRLSSHACIAVWCGNSEVEQQAAMMGIEPAAARHPLFYERLPRWVAELHPGVSYVPSTPWSAETERLPFSTDDGLTHYYGIGAYQRPLSELRAHDVRFSPEALGFAHVPGLAQRKALFNNETAVLHHPLWKQRTPRDANAGWDFEDVRDHYLRQLLGLDAARLRYEQPEFYWRVSAFVSGEVMRRVFAEWRSVHSRCRGALVWFLKDLWAGAGWGIIDSDGEPKSAWYALRRIWQSRGLCVTDENLNGLDVHVFNESALPLRGRLRLRVFGQRGTQLLEAGQDIELAPRERITVNSSALIGRFFDLTYAYRFGPLAHELVTVELLAEDGERLIDHYLPRAALPQPVEASALQARAEAGTDGRVRLQLQAQRLIHALHVEARGYRCSDNDFHLAPGEEREILLQPLPGAPARFSCTLDALNLSEALRVRLNS